MLGHEGKTRKTRARCVALVLALVGAQACAGEASVAGVYELDRTAFASAIKEEAERMRAGASTPDAKLQLEMNLPALRAMAKMRGELRLSKNGGFVEVLRADAGMGAQEIRTEGRWELVEGRLRLQPEGGGASAGAQLATIDGEVLRVLRPCVSGGKIEYAFRRR